jgi:CDP-paratose 2-epimerase
MKYLITGGAGFLGSNLAYELLKNENHEVYLFDNLSRVGSSENLEWLKSEKKSKSFSFHYGDIRNPFDVDQALYQFRPDFIFHLAGQVAMTTSIKNPRLDFEINALGTLNILEAIRKNVPQAGIIYSSTNKVYGDLEFLNYTETSTRYQSELYPEGFDENLPLDFHSPYGCSKGCGDQYILDYSRIFNINGAVFRHSSLLGGRQFSTFDQGWVGWFCSEFINRKNISNTSLNPVKISGDGKQVRDILFADDVIKLYIKASEEITKIKGQAFNIGGGIKNSLSLLELFVLLEEKVGVKVNIEKGPTRESDQKFFVASGKKVYQFLNWLPETSKEMAIEKMLDWTRKSMTKGI